MTLEERIPIKVLFDRKDAAEWQRLNPVIDDGELVVELDTHRLKVGDGKLNYNDLPYYEGPQGESITKVQLSENGDLSVWIGEKETKLGNIKGQKGDKGTSITDITKEGETLTITLSDDTQKTFSIPNGQKGDRGKGVESARVDEAGHLRLKIEEEQEKDLGNVKGDKGDSITITDQQRVSEGVQLTFSDKTKVVIPKGEKGDTGDARGINLDNYVTKSELKTAGVADVKAINDFLGLSQKVFTSNYSYSDSLLKSYSSPSYSASWYVNESTKDVNVKDKVLITISNTTTRVDNYLEVSVTYVGSNYVTATSTGKLLTTPGEVNVLTKEQIAAAYAKKEHKHEIDDVNGLQAALNHKANAQHSHSQYLERSEADSKYATKGDLETISLPSDVLTQSIASNLYVLKEDAQSYVTWQILEQSVRAKANAIHSHRMDDVIGLNQALSDRPTTERMAQAMETIMRDVVKQSDLRNVVYQGQLAGYATKAELQQIETTPGPQGPPGQQGNPGRPGRDAVLNVEVVSSAPSYQQPNVIYLVKG
ncbi:hypothetical protein PJ262_02625 [Streptococcus dysgalactiae]|nr:hypothetical protein [Streptococcus dysgalactiae]WCE86567.1 hypothetical protein PMN45_03010 [Streptococcus dysgalactiae]WCN26562.1 hypothetical protein PP188_03020 [Streptococcus dysgalactiae]